MVIHVLNFSSFNTVWRDSCRTCPNEVSHHSFGKVRLPSLQTYWWKFPITDGNNSCWTCRNEISHHSFGKVRQPSLQRYWWETLFGKVRQLSLIGNFIYSDKFGWYAFKFSMRNFIWKSSADIPLKFVWNATDLCRKHVFYFSADT